MFVTAAIGQLCCCRKSKQWKFYVLFASVQTPCTCEKASREQTLQMSRTTKLLYINEL